MFPTHDKILAKPAAAMGSRCCYSFVKDKKTQKKLGNLKTAVQTRKGANPSIA